jgi:RHS repeat-associated protein
LVPPVGSGATFFYYDGWNLVQEGSSGASASRNYVHGARVDEIVKQITPGNWSERYFHYEARGHCAFQTDPSGNIMEQYDFDAFGWPYFYDASGYDLGYSPFGNRFLFTGREWLQYDAFGQPGQFKDERGNTTYLTYQWGPMKKLATVTTKRSKDAGGIEDQRTTFSFDLMGRLLQTNFPDMSYEQNTYKYGQLMSSRTRKGQWKFIHYDVRGREDSNSWQNLNGNCDLATDNGAAACITREWDAANRLSRIRNKVSTINYTYDDASQVWTESDTVTGAPDTANLIYLRYPDGGMAHVHYPNGVWVRHDYTARGQLKRVYDSAVGWKVPVEYSYLSDGKVSYADYADNTHTDYRYDPRGFTSFFLTFKRSSGGQEIYRRNYYRDERDRITAIQRGTSNPANLMENGRGDHFWYDEEGQLVESYYGALDPANNPHDPGRSDFYSYDELGNRKGQNYLPTRGWTTFTRKDNGLNQYGWWYPMPAFYDQDLSGWGSAGLANGVLMQDGNITAGYNALNQMVMVQGHSQAGTSNWTFFGYDPLGRRVQQWVGQLANLIPPVGSGATFFYYDGWNLAQEGSSGASASRNYVHGARVDEIVKQITPGNWSERYFHYEARGHCAFQTDPSGNIMEQYDFDAFGWPYFYDAGGNNLGYSLFGNRFLFTGREWLSDLKLYDFRNRMYQPELGRFMQPDPKEFAAGDYNLYRYCHNDPVNKIDPTGLLEFEIRGDLYFTLKVNEQLQTLESRPMGFSYLQELRDSPFRQIIIPGPVNATLPLDGPNSMNGGGSGSLYRLNPLSSEGGRDSKGDTTRPPFVGAGHEIAGHGIENKRGEAKPSALDKKTDRIPASERDAVQRENEIRKEHGVPERLDYRR